MVLFHVILGLITACNIVLAALGDKRDAETALYQFTPYAPEKVEFFIFIGVFILFLPLTDTVPDLILNFVLVTVTDVFLSYCVVDYFYLHPHLHQERTTAFYLFLAVMVTLILVSFIAAFIKLFFPCSNRGGKTCSGNGRL